jgi:thiol-disulfide isomerase/thioredoxin
MKDEKKSLFPAGRLILIAAVAGALAGAVAVYVRTTLPGNNATNAPVAQIGGSDADACASRAENAKTVAAAATGDVAAMLPADPPQSLRGLTFNAPDGAKMTLADRAGKVLLVNLWATWCFPCREEMPALNALQKEMGSETFEVVAINVDTGDDAKPRKFMSETGVDALGYYRENTLDLFNDVKARGLALGLPVTLLVDSDGCLLSHMNGPADWAGGDARRFLSAAMADQPSTIPDQKNLSPPTVN